MCGARHFKTLRRFRFLLRRALMHGNAVALRGYLLRSFHQSESSFQLLKRLYVHASRLMRQALGPAACFYRTYHRGQ